jgi:hypothetical protein
MLHSTERRNGQGPQGIVNPRQLFRPESGPLSCQCPLTIRELPLLRAVRFHDPDRSLWLKRVVVKRGFILETILTPVPHDVLVTLAADRVGPLRYYAGRLKIT